MTALLLTTLFVIVFAALGAIIFRPRYDSTIRFCGLCSAWVAVEHWHTEEMEGDEHGAF